MADSDIEDNEEQDNPLQISDEEFMDMPDPVDEIPVEESKEEDTTIEEEEVDNTSKEDNEEEELTESTDDSSEETKEDTTNESEDPEQVESKKESTTEDDGEDVKEEQVNVIDYEAEYKKLTAPFRANNKDIQVTSVDDALNLMKMGANYNKKMAGLKPNIKLMKMLENNELLDESKLSYLIDLHKKDPEAINKFIKESGVDPLDIDTEKDTNYKPNTYTVDDKEVELDSVLDDIRDSRSFKDTIDIVTKKLDEPSKKIVLEDPQIINVINQHVEAGIYDKVMDVVDNERTLGRLKGMSDLEAYKYVGDVINANGGFDNKPAPESNSIPPTAKKENSVVEAKRKAKKKAASNTKGNPVGSKKDDFNPLNMTDEEFEKATAGSLY